MIPEKFIEELKYASDIEQVIGSYVTLQKKGRNLSGLCPFHSEKTPSFTVYPDTQSYYCFGCGNGGDVVTFIRQAENLEYMDAMGFLAKRAGLSMPEQDDSSREASIQRTRVLEINRESARFFYDQLCSPMGTAARQYLQGRGLTSKTIRTFGIGYACEDWDRLNKHLLTKGFAQKEILTAAVATTGRGGNVYDLFRSRIIFPIIDLRGSIIGFGGRLLGDKGPKYLNSPDTPVFKKSRHLFSLNFAKSSESDTLILGEGYMDVIAMVQAGFQNSVATLGTSLTPEQARLIAQYAKKVIIAYDSDGAGQTAAKRAINLFSETTVSVSVLQLTDAKDPDEFIKKFGAERFQSLLDGGKSALDFAIDKLKNNYDLTSNQDKVTFLGEFCRLISEVNNPLQRDIYIGQIAQELDITKSSILLTVNGIRKKQFHTREQQDSRKLATSISDNVGTEQKRFHQNVEGVVAEGLLITLLLLHPDYYASIQDQISPADFKDPGYREIFGVLAERIAGNLPLDLIHFSSSLAAPLMGKLSNLILKGQELKFYPGQAKEYVDAIQKSQKQKNPQQLAEMTSEEYLEYLSSLQADKK